MHSSLHRPRASICAHNVPQPLQRVRDFITLQSMVVRRRWWSAQKTHGIVAVCANFIQRVCTMTVAQRPPPSGPLACARHTSVSQGSRQRLGQAPVPRQGAMLAAPHGHKRLAFATQQE